MEDLLGTNKKLLLKVVNSRMPYGKYKGYILMDIPEDYLLWFKQKGMPKGELGVLLEIVYDMKLNGLDNLLDPLRNRPRQD